jgi:hypothetical protein
MAGDLRIVARALGLSACCLLTMTLAAPAGAEPQAERVPASYVVFEIPEEGSPRPIFYRDVELRAPLRSSSADQDVIAVELRSASGELLFGDRLRLYGARLEGPGERHADGATTLQNLQPFGPRYALARVPRHAGARLHVGGGKLRSAGFELDALAAAAEVLPLAGLGRTPVGDAFRQANSGNRVDVLVMGDGFVDAGDFAADTSSVVEQFFQIEPYATYRSYFNVETLYTPSPQEGADHPPYRADCLTNDLSCCPDTAAQTDPRAGTYVDTAFHGRFCGSGQHRVTVVNYGATLAAASAVPDWDLILMVLNDPVYGGSGGAIPTFSTSDDAVEVAQHEFGHAFTDLADEYDTAYPGFPPCSDVGGPACEANVTDAVGGVKWAPFIAGGTPIPTPEGSFANAVGLFEGARYQASGVYRPRDRECLMHFLGKPFCEVCLQAFVLRLYQGGWGDPDTGIQMIEPGSERPNPASTVQASSALDLRFDVLQPSRGRHVIEWRVNGQLQAGATNALFRFDPAQGGTYQVEATVRDTSAFVHPALAGDVLEQRRQWTVVRAPIVSPGTITFAHPNFSVAENLGPAAIRIDRVGGTTGAVAVTFKATAGTATAGVDFATNDVTLTWSDGDNLSRLVNLFPFDDAIGEDDETVLLTLSQPQGGATLGVAAATLTLADDDPIVCTADATTLCLGEDGRFRVRVGWRDFQDVSGAGKAYGIGRRDSGLFYFFDENNIELLVKVLDGCAINQRFWIFYAATTNVEMRVEVFDTRTRATKVYTNPLGSPAAPVLDTDALNSCS